MKVSVWRLDGKSVRHTLRIEGNRESLEDLLPRCTPLFIYRRDGEDLVRICLPPGLMDGAKDMVCPCCDTGVIETPDGGVSLDVAYADVDWYVKEETTKGK